MRAVVFVVLCLAAAWAAPPPGTQRIVGGELTTINEYPNMAAILFFFFGDFPHGCGGTILNQRSILTAGGCFIPGMTEQHIRVRLGSTYANSGGVVHSVTRIIRHPDYMRPPMDNDVAVLHVTPFIVYTSVIQPAYIAGPTYDLPDNAPVWATGWGATSLNGPWSEQLRHVQLYVVNHELCNNIFFGDLTPNMLCAGVLGVGGRDQCEGDTGGPLYHGNVVVGICSFGIGCGLPQFPGINARVSRFANWIEAQA